MQQTLEFEGAFSFGQSQRSEWYILKNKEIPGPGSHKMYSTLSAQKWSIGKQAKKPSFIPPHTNAPIGSYNIDCKQVFSNPTAITIPKTIYEQKNNSITLEVNYDPNESVTKTRAPIYSLGNTQPYTYQNDIPAPNVYNTQKPKSKSQFNRSKNYFTLGLRTSPYQGREFNPGVGDYNVKYDDSSKQQIKFPTSKRPPNEVSPDSPGMRQLIMKQNLKKFNAGITFAPKYKQKSIQQAPGPSSYNPKIPERQKKIILFTSRRSQLVDKQQASHPNPGKYNLSGSLDKGVSFPLYKRPEVQIKMGPGPGQYESNLSTLNTISGKMGWKCPRQQKFITPSPSNYKPNSSYIDKRSKHPVNLYSDRIDFSKSDTEEIGPGAYNVRGGLGKELGTIGKSRRFHHKNQNPGPGQYNITSNTIGRLPKYLKSVKRKIEENGQTKIIKYDPSKMITKSKGGKLIDDKVSQTIQ